MVFLVAALLVFGTAVKIHSAMSPVSARDLNSLALEKISELEKTNGTGADFTFAVFGDNRSSRRVFNEIIRTLGDGKVLFAVNEGDLVDEGDMNLYKTYVGQVEGAKMPVLAVIGNHDAGPAGRGYFYRVFGPFYYSFVIDGSYFIVLDNADGDIDPIQQGWLRGELERSRSCANRFVFMHMPLFDPREGKHHCMKDGDLARRLGEMFDAYNVTTVFASHIHGYYEGKWGRTPYVITGGAGAKLGGGDPAHYYYHYVEVNISNGLVERHPVKLDVRVPQFWEGFVLRTWARIYSFFDSHYFSVVLVVSIMYFFFFALYRLGEEAGRRRLQGEAESPDR